MNINRLLRRLEAAISKGKHQEAAQLAHDLAEMRLNCSVTRNKHEAEQQAIEITLQNKSIVNDTNLEDINGESSNKNANNKSAKSKTCETNGSATTTPSPLLSESSNSIEGEPCLRNNKVDASRREVKSDNVSRLLDEETSNDQEGEIFE